jgi:hypothetical protein
MCAYKISDPDYLDRLDASRALATALALFAGPRLAGLRMLRNMRETIVGPVAVAVAVSVGASLASDDAELSAREAISAATESIAHGLAEVEAEIAAKVTASYAGFAEICREEMGLEANVVLRAHLEPLPIVAELDELDGQAEAEGVKRWADSFRRAWRACPRARLSGAIASRCALALHTRRSTGAPLARTQGFAGESHGARGAVTRGNTVGAVRQIATTNWLKPYHRLFG